MLRLRDTAGNIHELPDTVRFVELCDMQGSAAQVFYIDDTGVHKVLDSGSKEAQRYSQLMNVKFIPIQSP
jgi:hypothetical protein